MLNLIFSRPFMKTNDKYLNQYIDGTPKTLQQISEMCGLTGKALVKWIKRTIPEIKYSDKRKRLYSAREVILIAENWFGFDRKSIKYFDDELMKENL